MTPLLEPLSSDVAALEPRVDRRPFEEPEVKVTGPAWAWNWAREGETFLG